MEWDTGQKIFGWYSPSSGKKTSIFAKPEKITLFSSQVKIDGTTGGWAESGRLCTAFGGQKNQAFPIDTWILQSLKKQYSMSDWKISQMQEFARIHFGQHAGLAQQFLFSYQRILSQDTEQKEGKNLTMCFPISRSGTRIAYLMN